MQKLLFIYNPHAGKGRVRGKLGGILNAFAKADCLTTVWPTRGRGDATVGARTAAGYDRVVCSGGDGTLHEVIVGLLDLPEENRPVLGYIPAGTTNDFARNLFLPKTMEEQATLAATGPGLGVDIGLLNELPFVYVAAFGLFADTSYSTPQELKNALGHLAYVLKGITELSNLKTWHLKVEHDDGILEGEYIYGMISNTISVGGLIGLPADEVSLQDGLLEGILVKAPNSIAQLNAAVVALARQEYTEESGVIGLHSSRFRVTGSEPMSITLDGEFGGSHTEMNFSAIHTPVEIVSGKK